MPLLNFSHYFQKILGIRQSFGWQFPSIDKLLFFFLLLLCLISMPVLYSASTQPWHSIVFQGMHDLIAFIMLFICAAIHPMMWRRAAPWLYFTSIATLLVVLIIGHIGKGAQRWLHVGMFNIQPAELIKLTLPLFIAWYYRDKHLPSSMGSIAIVLCFLILPVFLTAKQPDLGSALLLFFSGIALLGLVIKLSWKYCLILFLAFSICLPLGWHTLHDYQRQRLLTFMNPERDPLGAGYHIIQSKIALGSGGLFGKGWLNGTQSHLHFLPEHTTDFIFAVIGEEFGFIGSLVLILLYAVIILRGIYIMLQAENTFSRLLAGGIIFMFFISFFINMSMVTGMLPVVGVPLPLMSYGGSSIVVTMANFGILMSIQAHR